MVTIAMILAAVSLAAILHRPAPNVTCQSGAVSYKFVGAPGTQFTYTGKQYTVPPRGWIELIGHGRDSKYAANGRDLSLDVWPIDDFGMRTVPLPAPQTSSKEGHNDSSSGIR